MMLITLLKTKKKKSVKIFGSYLFFAVSLQSLRKRKNAAVGR